MHAKPMTPAAGHAMLTTWTNLRSNKHALAAVPSVNATLVARATAQRVPEAGRARQAASQASKALSCFSTTKRTVSALVSTTLSASHSRQLECRLIYLFNII